MNENGEPSKGSGKKIIVVIIVLILIFSGVYIFIDSLSLIDLPWVFSQPEIYVNKTTTGNITTEVIVGMDSWAENYHDKYHIDEMIVTISTWIEHNETFLFNLSTDYRQDLGASDENIPVNERLSQVFNNHGIQLSDEAFVQYVNAQNVEWLIRDNYPNGPDYPIQDLVNVLEVHLPETENGDYRYQDKLSTIIGEHEYPVTFYDVDGDTYLSVGDYFITDPSKISEEEFDYLDFNIRLVFGSHKETILIHEQEA